MPTADLNFKIYGTVRVSYTEEETPTIENMKPWELADRFSDDMVSHMDLCDTEVEEFFPLEEKTDE